jgi:dTMP kinase
VTARGAFIVFEGPEGSGKSTQARLLVERLTLSGLNAVSTREPGGTELGEAIRGIVLDRSFDQITPVAEALLYSAARAQHVAEVISPALAKGTFVVCDRFSDSTLAYQGGGLDLNLEALVAIQAFATGETRPDLKILLDLEADTGLARRFTQADQVNRIDEAALEFHQRVRDTFLRLAEGDGDIWIVVDALLPVSEIADLVFDAVRHRFSICSDHTIAGNDVTEGYDRERLGG